MAFSIAGTFMPPIVCKDNHSLDAHHIRRAAEIADKSAGFTAPHPNFGCVIAKGPKIVGEGFLYAEGTKCAELQAVEAAGELCRGATAFLNMEPGDCHGDQTAVSAIIKAGVSRVVLGMRHPLKHLRGNAVRSLRSEGVQVDVLGEDLQSKIMQEALKSCFLVNAPLLYRAASRVPFSVLKYAMTLDGKIAASSGHASWISSKESRHHVFELRGRSDAIIVGGNTVRRDDPRLTIRNGRGHLPVRIVMSQTLNVPEIANLWDVSEVRTIVATQRGARRSFQKLLAAKGVEVVEFDILNPRDVMEYCHNRGYLSIFWECGGTLAASAISSGVIHKVYSFVAPKIIGGVSAPSPVGELGMVEMTQALELIDVSYQQDLGFIFNKSGQCLGTPIGNFVPGQVSFWTSGQVSFWNKNKEGSCSWTSKLRPFLQFFCEKVEQNQSEVQADTCGIQRSLCGLDFLSCLNFLGHPQPDAFFIGGAPLEKSYYCTYQAKNIVIDQKIGPDMLISGFLQPIPDLTPVIPSADETSVIDPTVTPFDANIIFFYKTWDPYGAFSNFSPHPLRMPDGNGGYLTWPSVEHYYQAHKFVGVNDPSARDCVEEIKFAKSPEEAARVGRTLQRKHPTLVRSDWETVKIDIMYSALKCKFSIYPHLNSVLLSTEGSVLVEASPHDLFWGGGREGEGLNYLGRLLMQLRSEFLGES